MSNGKGIYIPSEIIYLILEFCSDDKYWDPFQLCLISRQWAGVLQPVLFRNVTVNGSTNGLSDLLRRKPYLGTACRRLYLAGPPPDPRVEIDALESKFFFLKLVDILAQLPRCRLLYIHNSFFHFEFIERTLSVLDHATTYMPYLQSLWLDVRRLALPLDTTIGLLSKFKHLRELYCNGFQSEAECPAEAILNGSIESLCLRVAHSQYKYHCGFIEQALLWPTRLVTLDVEWMASYSDAAFVGNIMTRALLPHRETLKCLKLRPFLGNGAWINLDCLPNLTQMTALETLSLDFVPQIESVPRRMLQFLSNAHTVRTLEWALQSSAPDSRTEMTKEMHYLKSLLTAGHDASLSFRDIRVRLLIPEEPRTWLQAEEACLMLLGLQSDLRSTGYKISYSFLQPRREYTDCEFWPDNSEPRVIDSGLAQLENVIEMINV